jgi:hypothetical protein
MIDGTLHKKKGIGEEVAARINAGTGGNDHAGGVIFLLHYGIGGQGCGQHHPPQRRAIYAKTSNDLKDGAYEIFSCYRFRRCKDDPAMETDRIGMRAANIYSQYHKGSSQTLKRATHGLCKVLNF